MAIAQALIMKPPILLTDKPFGALDPDTREELRVFLWDLWVAESLTIFFVTHDSVETCFLGTRILVLSQYYTDDRGDVADVKRGGKIVADYQLTKMPYSTQIKQDKKFQDLIDTVRAEGFDPKVLQHVHDFNLKHPHLFRTLTKDVNTAKGSGV